MTHISSRRARELEPLIDELKHMLSAPCPNDLSTRLRLSLWSYENLSPSTLDAIESLIRSDLSKQLTAYTQEYARL